MEPGPYDISLKQGRTFKERWELTEEDENEVSTPLDLTGMTIRGAGKQYADSVEFIFEISSPASGISIIDAVGGIVEIEIECPDDAPVFETGVTDFVLEGGGDREDLLEGRLRVDRAVTP